MYWLHGGVGGRDYCTLSILLPASRVSLQSEVGKDTLKINGDEALSDESVEKSKGDKALNDNFY